MTEPSPQPSPQPTPQPAQPPKPPAQEQPVQPAANLPEQYIHPCGFTIRYPKGWTMAQDGEGGLYLVPPNIPNDNQGQPVFSVRLILSAPQSVRVIADASRDVIEQGIIELFAQAGLRLTPVGAAEAIPGRSSAAVSRFSARAPDGSDFRLAFYRTLADGLLLQFMAAGRADAAAAHHPTLCAIVAAVEYAAPARDPQLIGDWKNVEILGGGAGVFQYRRVYNADGTYRSDSRGMAEGFDTGTDPGSTGRWFAANGHAAIVTADGNLIVFQYTMHNGQIAEKLAGGKYRFWER